MTVPPPPNDPAGRPAPPAGTVPPGTDLSSDLGASLTFAGNGLLRNPVAYLVPGIIYSLVTLVIVIGGTVAAVALLVSRLEASGALESSDAVPWTDMAVFYAVALGAALLAAPFALLWQSGAARAAGVVLEGSRPTIGQALIGPGRVLLTALLVGVITAVGMLLCYLPGVVAAVMLMYAIPASVRGASPLAALTQSVALARANLGTTIVAWLVMSVASSIAAAVIVGVLVLFPLMMLFQLGLYERLNGRTLPEPARA